MQSVYDSLPMKNTPTTMKTGQFMRTKKEKTFL